MVFTDELMELFTKAAAGQSETTCLTESELQLLYIYDDKSDSSFELILDTTDNTLYFTLLGSKKGMKKTLKQAIKTLKDAVDDVPYTVDDIYDITSLTSGESMIDIYAKMKLVYKLF